jgi:hypothetical protein
VVRHQLPVRHSNCLCWDGYIMCVGCYVYLHLACSVAQPCLA